MQQLALSLLVISVLLTGETSAEYKALGYQKACTSTDGSPAGREQAAIWQIGTDVYIYGGFTPVNVQSSEFWKLDLTTWAWTFISGEKTSVDDGSFGTLGVASSSNHPSGRRGQAYATDSSNKLLYMFGGTRPESTVNMYLNDLWVYSIDDAMWTWIAGTSEYDQLSSLVDGPGARNFASGAFANSKFYVFGGVGCGFDYCNGTFAELWEFTVSTSTYSLVTDGSSTATPSQRWSSSIVTTGTTLILFGGIEVSMANLNDVWTFDASSSSYTWTLKSSGGTGVVPSGRFGHVSWASSTSDSTIYISSGSYYDAETASESFLDDFWSFDLETAVWSGEQEFEELALVRAGAFQQDENLYIYGGINEFSIKSETIQILCPTSATDSVCDAASACEFFVGTSTTETYNIRETIISGAVVLGLGFVLLLLRIILSRIYPNSRPEFLIAFVIGTCDFITDLYFTIELGNSKNNRGLFYAAIASLCLSAITNLLIIRSIALKELQRNDPTADQLRKHLAERRFLWMIAVFMSSFNLQCFLLLCCGVTQFFNCRLSPEGIEKIKKWSMVGIFLEDIPQFTFQVLHSLFLGTITPVTIVSFIFTATSIFSGLVFSLLADIMVKSLKAKKRAKQDAEERSETLVVSGPRNADKDKATQPEDPKCVASLIMVDHDDLEVSERSPAA